VKGNTHGGRCSSDSTYDWVKNESGRDDLVCGVEVEWGKDGTILLHLCKSCATHMGLVCAHGHHGGRCDHLDYNPLDWE